MKNWKTIGALLIIALMALTGCPAPTGGDDLPDNDGTTMVAAVPVISDWDQLGIDGSVNAPPKEEIAVSSLVSDGPEIIVGDAPTLLIADASDGKTVFLGFASSSSAEESPQAALNIESTLLSLILIKLGGIPGDAKEDILDLAKQDAQYGAALQELTEAYRVNPYILDEIMNHQTLVDKISGLAQRALDAYIATIEETEAASRASVPAALSVAGETKSFRSFLSPWKSGSPWTWYYEKEGIVSLDDPPFFARSADSQSAIGSKGYINYAARFYTETGEEYYYAIMTRNGSLIDYARNSGAAFTSLPQTWFRSETAHIHFGRLAEEPFAMVLNFVNVMGAVMNVVADGKGFHYISDTLASNASTLVKYATVYQQIAPLASRMSQATDAAGFFGQFSLETLTSVMTDNVIPLLKLVVNANSVKNAALHKIWIKGSAKLAAKISTPAGWAVMIFDGVNSLVPTVSSMITSPVQAGYDLNWQSGNVVEVSRNDTRPVAEQTTHTVSFNSNGGSSVSSQQVEEGSYASEPTAPTRSGYVFRGWYGNSSLTNAWAFGSDTVDSDITLYAKWEMSAVSRDYSIGDTGPAGGIVFYDKGSYSDGWRYLEAALSDRGSDVGWGGDGTTVGGTSTAIGSGKSNTEKIVNKLGSGSYAARLCYDLELGGYDDWFLPSRDELNELYKQKNTVGGFASKNYWSSSETNSYLAWLQDFSSGYQYSGSQYVDGIKRIDNYVRAVRAF